MIDCDYLELLLHFAAKWLVHFLCKCCCVCEQRGEALEVAHHMLGTARHIVSVAAYLPMVIVQPSVDPRGQEVARAEVRMPRLASVAVDNVLHILMLQKIIPLLHALFQRRHALTVNGARTSDKVAKLVELCNGPAAVPLQTKGGVFQSFYHA